MINTHCIVIANIVYYLSKTEKIIGTSDKVLAISGVGTGQILGIATASVNNYERFTYYKRSGNDSSSIYIYIYVYMI